MGSTAAHIILYLEANKVFNTKGPPVLLEALLGFPFQQGTFAPACCCATAGNLDRFICCSSLAKRPLSTNPLLLRISDSDFQISISQCPEAAGLGGSWKCAVCTLIFQQPVIVPRNFLCKLPYWEYANDIRHD